MGVRLRQLYAPEPVAVAASPAGVPRWVDGAVVETVREEWKVIDRWWERRTLRRHYFELALADGRAVVVFRAHPGERWFRQRA